MAATVAAQAAEEKSTVLTAFVPTLAFRDFVAAVEAGNQPPGSLAGARYGGETGLFDSTDTQKVRIERIKTIIATKESPSPRSEAFNRVVALQSFMDRWPVVDDLAKVKKGPCWLFDPSLSGAFLGLVHSDEFCVLQPHVGFNYCVQEVSWHTSQMLVAMVKPAKGLNGLTTPNMLLIIAHDRQEGYNELCGKLTRESIEGLIPVGLVIDE